MATGLCMGSVNKTVGKKQHISIYLILSPSIFNSYESLWFDCFEHTFNFFTVFVLFRKDPSKWSVKPKLRETEERPKLDFPDGWALMKWSIFEFGRSQWFRFRHNEASYCFALNWMKQNENTILAGSTQKSGRTNGEPRKNAETIIKRCWVSLYWIAAWLRLIVVRFA